MPAESSPEPAEQTARGVVGVCGAGLMGGGIAEAFASAGHEVILYDSFDGAADAAVARVLANFDKAVAKGRMAPEQASAARSRIRSVGTLDALGPAGHVVEAIIEDLRTKQDLFRELERVCAPDAALVTNTSTLSPTEIASALQDPSRAAGVHFFNPAPRMRLVELIPAEQTAESTTAALRRWLEGIGKEVVEVNEAPGGIVSRLQLLVRNEAVRMLAEGVASAEDIDKAMRLGAGWPLGPLELIDLVGVDMHVNNCDSLAREMGSDRYSPHPSARKLMRAGRLGRKAGRGFYRYDR
jgi:3-hydroxybutyryl-CoA dehydrogenase